MKLSMHSKSSWGNHAVVYQIYPRSFQDSNNDGVGDLQGIIWHLDYLKNLGIDAIWLSPVYESPMADFGYDISDHTQIDRLFGNLSDIDLLIKEAHQRDIKIMMDYVPNHTSDKHHWFIESRSSKDNPKRDWYYWHDGKNGGPPNNWVSVFWGSAWQWDEKTDQYYLHSFMPEQPDLNWRNPEVKDAMKHVLKFWLDRGVDGFRMDAFYWVYKNAQLLDEPKNPNYDAGPDDYGSWLHPYTVGQTETKELVAELMEYVNQWPDKFVITELWDLEPAELAQWYRSGKVMNHAPFNFKLFKQPWNAGAYRWLIDNYDREVGTDFVPIYVLGNHDSGRVVSRYGEKQARLLAMLELTLRGQVYIYQGEEIGMHDVFIPDDKKKDPSGKLEASLNRDPQRTPMQWNSDKYSGFSNVETWLPVADDYQNNNVQLQWDDPKSMLSLYRQLIALRKNSKVLLEGTYQSFGDDNYFGFWRELDGEKILVVLNYADFDLNVNVGEGVGNVLISTYLDKKDQVNLAEIKLRGLEGLVIKIV